MVPNNNFNGSRQIELLNTQVSLSYRETQQVLKTITYTGSKKIAFEFT
jgi:hypothetical protein